MKHDYSIEREHIILVPMDEQTSECYRKLRNREDNRNFFFNSVVIEKEQQEKWFQNYLNKQSEYMFAVFLKEKMEFVGGIGIYDIDLFRKTAEVGRIIIDRNLAAGKGYGTEAIKGVCRIAQDKLNLEEMYAYIYSANLASIKAFFKAGFSERSIESENKETIKVSMMLSQ